MKHRITLTDGEIAVLAHLTRHFTDYMHGDDRPDHGLGILKGYRDSNLKAIRGSSLVEGWKKTPDHVKDLITAMGKFNRFDRKNRRRTI